VNVSFGFLNFHLYGFILGIAILTGYFVVLKRAKKYDVSEKAVDLLFLFVVLGGLIGARVYHVLDKWGYYSKNPIQIIEVWNGGLAIYGAIIGGIFFLWIFTKIKSPLQGKQKSKVILSYLDLIVLGLAVSQAIGRLGNFFNQEAFGMPTSLPWGVFIKENNRPDNWKQYEYFHPTFFYESIWMFFGFFLLLWVEKRIKNKGEGIIFSIYLIWYGLGRFFLEFLRFDTARIGIFNIAQVFSFIFVMLGVFIIKSKLKGQNLR